MSRLERVTDGFLTDEVENELAAGEGEGEVLITLVGKREGGEGVAVGVEDRVDGNERPGTAGIAEGRRQALMVRS